MEEQLENKVTTVVNVLHAKKEEIYPAYLSKHNLNREEQVIFSNDSKQKCHYLVVQKPSALLSGIT